MKGYVFISNSSKPSFEKAESREPITLSNVNRPCLSAALKMGYQVFFGVNRSNPENLECELPVSLFDSHTYRSITALGDNIKAYNNLSRVIKNNNIDVIHCNTPIGGLIGRLCGKRYSIKKVIYTAHGFHFYKGAPFINRFFYKTAEKLLARWTDVIITMNEEDFNAAKGFRLKKGGKVYKVHGVGITLENYDRIEVDKVQKRKEINVPTDAILCICAGDLVLRKNFKSAIEAIGKLDNKKVHFAVCGTGPEKENLIELSKRLHIEDRIHFLGFRNDVKELLSISDIYLFTSLQEGLPRSLMEAMAVGLPVVASKIRGNVDLIENGIGGFLSNPYDIEDIACCIGKLCASEGMRKKMGQMNLLKIREFDVSVVEKEINSIYQEVL